MEKTMILLSFLAFASAAFAERKPFDWYQDLATSSMFGVVPSDFDPTKLPSEVSKTDQKQLSQEQEQLKSKIHFSVINVTPGGETVVGFTDKSVNPPKHYYLKVGDESDGWRVKEADAAESSMVVVKDSVEVSLKIGGDSEKDAKATTKAGGTKATAFDKTDANRGNILPGGGETLRARRGRKAEEKEKDIDAKVDAKVEARVQMMLDLNKGVENIKYSRESESAKAEAEKSKAEAEKFRAEAEKAKAEAEKFKAETEKIKNESENSEEESDSEDDSTSGDE